MTEALVMILALAGGGWLALRPFMGRAVAWPEDPPDVHDDVARAVSSLRDLEFARAAGTIDAADEATLRARIEASAFARHDERAPSAPVRTLALAALLAGAAAVAIVALLPASAGDRAPGATITGSTPAAPSLETLETRARATPDDIPTRLALADAYEEAGRANEASEQYRAVLSLDADNVAALNGLGILLYRSGSLDGAALAADRVLRMRPRDADALFLKGLVLYTQERYADAVKVWTVYLEVGEFHGAAQMVRALYDDAKRRGG